MGKSRLMMRTDLATDLKITIDTEMTAAELNRCIEVAVSDLSRFLPRERTYEEILDFTVSGEEVEMPLDTDGSKVVNTESLTSKVAGSTCTIDGQPDVPRPLRYSLTDSDDSITGMTLIVQGIDKDDLAVEEVYSYIKGDDKVGQMGKKYFKAVYSVEIDQIAGTPAGDILEIGYGSMHDVWVDLAYKPVKWGSESSVTDGDSNAIVRDTDFFIDYINGRIKSVSGGDIVAEDTVTISYTKNQVGIDLSGLADFIRVHRTEYPVGDIPQTFVQTELFGKMLMITGQGELEEQQSLQDKKQVRIQYDASHTPPNDYAPGTVPEFLENTVLKAASALALLILALKQEHQAATDLGTARTAISDANIEQANMTASLANLKTYLVDNNEEDAVGILKDITDFKEDLRTAVDTALDAANGYLDNVDSYIGLANDVRAKYLTTTNYVDRGTEPSVFAYLETGDALLNTLAEGGENERTPEMYLAYARGVKEALIGSWEQDRLIYVQQATTEGNAALAYVQEAAQRLANLRTYIEEAAGWASISMVFAKEAEHRLTKMNVLLGQAAKSIEAAGGDLVMADRFRADAIERRDEVWTVWRDRKEYIGDFASSSMNQTVRE